MNYLISIIIPCYNCECFVTATIEMLLQQDISECELILVNDGSKDNTLSILRQYETLHENIHVIDQLNQGVSVARNVGMLAAQGKYIYFLDSDDTLTKGTLDHFKQVVMEHSDCQMLLFGYETRRNGRTCKSYVFPPFDGVAFSGYTLQRSFLSKKICCHICSCVYDKEFCLRNRLLFKQGVKIGEDIHFLLQLIDKVDRAYYSKRVSFIYQIRNDSVMQGYANYSDDNFNSFLLIKDFLSDVDGQLHFAANFFISISFISNMVLYLKSPCISKGIEKQFLQEKRVLYSPMHLNSFYSIIIYCFRLLPLQLLFKLKSIKYNLNIKYEFHMHGFF